MESQLVTANSFLTQDYSESFFSEVPTDGRFLSCNYQKFPPVSSIAGKTINFELGRFTASNVYLIQDTALEIVCKITKADGSKPAKTAVVAPNNNILHTAFEAVRVYINERCITPSPSYYHLKSYILNTLSYSSPIKASLLETQGYYADLSGLFDRTDENNPGFYSRNKLFREKFDSTGEYSSGTRFFGKLNLDLISCETGLLPGTKVRIELDKAPSSFVLSKPTTDAEKYQFQITDISLYVPVAVLSLPVYNQLNTIFAEKSVAIHYRKTEIKEVSLPKDKVEYVSDNLFPEDMPCRVVVCLIKNERKSGNYSTPYDFRRYWDVKTELLQEEDPEKVDLQKRIANLEATLSSIIESENSESPGSKGKGKGKGKRSNSFLSRFRFSSNDDGASTSSRSSVGPPPSYAEAVTDLTKRIYVKKIELLLNGSPLGNQLISTEILRYLAGFR